MYSTRCINHCVRYVTSGGAPFGVAHKVKGPCFAGSENGCRFSHLQYSSVGSAELSAELERTLSPLISQWHCYLRPTLPKGAEVRGWRRRSSQPWTALWVTPIATLLYLVAQPHEHKRSLHWLS
ncbi:hypothetical protein BDW22DRAFT_858717 [Trametopsis cervina]|nr:hypothetical protein BDW22DRAFT_858717 [Trametopsis cervina]